MKTRPEKEDQIVLIFQAKENYSFENKLYELSCDPKNNNNIFTDKNYLFP